MWDQLKSVIRSKNDKAIIIEDGKPLFVVMNMEEYVRLTEQEKQNTKSNDVGIENTSIDQSRSDLRKRVDDEKGLEHIGDYLENKNKDYSPQDEIDSIIDRGNLNYAEERTDLENFPY